MTSGLPAPSLQCQNTSGPVSAAKRRMRQHVVVLVDVERHQSADGRYAVDPVGTAIGASGNATRLSIIEFENFSSVNASKRRRTPVSISASIAAFTFPAPSSANTAGAVVQPTAPRVASSSTVTLFIGANVAASRVCSRIQSTSVSSAATRRARPVPKPEPGVRKSA
jgi:hypothetical protein